MLIVTKLAIFDMPTGTALRAEPFGPEHWKTIHPDTGAVTILARGVAEECDLHVQTMREALNRKNRIDGRIDLKLLVAAVKAFLEKIDAQTDRSHPTNGPDGGPVQRQQPIAPDG